jgi:hypothetical protein
VQLKGVTGKYGLFDQRKGFPGQCSCLRSLALWKHMCTCVQEGTPWGGGAVNVVPAASSAAIESKHKASQPFLELCLCAAVQGWCEVMSQP